MRKTGVLLLAAVMVAALLALPACDSGGGGGGSTKSIVGTWTCVQSSVPALVGSVWVFNANGTGSRDAVPFTYISTGATLTILTTVFDVAWISDTKVQLTSQATANWVILVKT